MERNNNSNSNSANRDGLLLRFESRSAATTSSDFVLQWGNRKRLRCMKVQQQQAKDQNQSSGPGQRATARIDRRVVRSDLNGGSSINATRDPNSKNINGGKTNGGSNGNGYINLRQRSASPSHRILRNSDTSLGMRGHSNGLKGLASPDRDCKKSGNNNTHQHHNKSKDFHNDHHSNHHAGGGGVSGSSEATHDAKKGGGGGGLSSSGDRDAITTMWLPKFVIALTNKEKEEDFMAFKGSKLSQRPKKRAKFVQRTLNLVLPGGWLSDLTLERYEVREKKVSKKRPRGLKGMGNMESDSE